ncbi:UPF0488 protein CG14286 [Diachasma alloeum]|uniref:UPF0488 protein CG14286 n=1 Tax=Diachasma alloeum TaxID=454923 RepID=UPI0007381542|nr:UPF0488 protein CG14286 [Diachasma alloeum]
MPPKFKPGGKRFPPKVTPKPVPQQVLATPGSSESSASGLDLETENKFELELCWCIQQLELSMNSNKLGDKQIRDAQKSLKLLKSNNVPLVQKRQIMRTTFGDYRAKMLQEEKKHSKSASTVRIVTPKPKENKSVFLKKAKGLSECQVENPRVEPNGEASNTNLAQMFRQSQTQERFQFNFTVSDVN